MVARCVVLSLIFVLFTSSANTVEASWQDPQIIISGSWGNQPNQFGIKHGDSDDIFPREIIVLANGDLWIADGLVNERLKLYDSAGNLKKIIPLDKATRTFPEYWFIGKFVGLGRDGSVYMSNYMGKNQYAQYSPTGQLIKTSAERPLELGSANSRSIGSGRYKNTVKYPDMTYQVVSEQPIAKYYRDLNKNLYLIESFTAVIEVAATDQDEDKAILSYKVHKYNQCSRELAPLSLLPLQTRDFPEGVEYGEPLVAVNGDAYTWKRSDTDYSIIKWTWVDDPNVPTGPDAPAGLSVMPSTTGLYLTWTASPQDPGCVTVYEVSRATSAGGVSSTIATVNAGVVKYNDTSASAGTMYYYKVRAVAGSEYSNYTSEVSGKR